MSRTQPIRRGYLILEDRPGSGRPGRSFEGLLRGAEISHDAIRAATNDRGYGEAVFNTSMTGYQEILTDPSYFGQIVCMTYPHIGNTGINTEDPESRRAWPAGFVVHELCEEGSNWRSQGSLEEYLIAQGIPLLTHVDTRALTRHIRSQGALRAVILDGKDLPRAADAIASLPSFEGRDMIREVTTSEKYFWPRSEKNRFRVAAVDFGVKWNSLRTLSAAGCQVEVFPATATAQEILASQPDGIFLSNGPGDPSAADYAIRTIQELLGKKPIFGICMGHQLLSIALGAKTYKLKFGHRGANQPVLDRTLSRVEITSQNHGYAVDPSSLPPGVEVTHLHLNDQTVAGIAVSRLRAFSVQFHPEACPGPHDSVQLFQRFFDAMGDSA